MKFIKLFSSIKQFPNDFQNNYIKWKKTFFSSNERIFNKLAVKGQKPKAMVIACCDSRIDVCSLFKSKIGDMFVHRNIANIVPSYKSSSKYFETAAALEYAVKTLKVPNIIILGHSKCGGIEAYYKKFLLMKNETKNNTTKQLKHLYNWLNVLNSSKIFFEGVLSKKNINSNLAKASIKVSLDNLVTYPFVKKAIKNNELKIFGLWHNIKNGKLYYYDKTQDKFEGF